jgi:flagellar biosynthetic protein FliP
MNGTRFVLSLMNGLHRPPLRRRRPERRVRLVLIFVSLLLLSSSAQAQPQTTKANAPIAETEPVKPSATPFSLPSGPDVWKSVQTVGLFAMVSLAPAAVLMLTSFVRIQIVLVLLRQALGSPQVPGNQVLTALALLLTALVMKPVGDVVYERAVAPLMANKIGPEKAWEAGSKPIKVFMVDQIVRTNHGHYLADLHSYAEPNAAEPEYGDEYPFLVIAPAFLLSELTTALTIGFIIYLPFLVIDLVVAAVLAAMGMFMLPPSLVSLPLKLILFVLADGWMLVASRLVQTFSIRPAG